MLWMKVASALVGLKPTSHGQVDTSFYLPSKNMNQPYTEIFVKRQLTLPHISKYTLGHIATAFEIEKSHS